LTQQVHQHPAPDITGETQKMSKYTLLNFMSISARSEKLSLTSKFLFAQGCCYAAVGALFAVQPHLAPVVFFMTEQYSEKEAGISRLVGIVAALIGYFYIQGARGNTEHFASSTIWDRFALPFALMPAAIWGNAPFNICLAFSILDPLLAFGTFQTWKYEHEVGDQKKS
jgi:H+/Cl- antiporter ClcA